MLYYHFDSVRSRLYKIFALLWSFAWSLCVDFGSSLNSIPFKMYHIFSIRLISRLRAVHSIWMTLVFFSKFTIHNLRHKKLLSINATPLSPNWFYELGIGKSSKIETITYTIFHTIRLYELSWSFWNSRLWAWRYLSTFLWNFLCFSTLTNDSLACKYGSLAGTISSTGLKGATQKKKVWRV